MSSTLLNNELQKNTNGIATNLIVIVLLAQCITISILAYRSHMRQRTIDTLTQRLKTQEDLRGNAILDQRKQCCCLDPNYQQPK